MATYLKKADPPVEEKDTQTRKIVKEILADIRGRGESAVKELAAKFDNWTRDFIVTQAELESLVATVPERTKADIRFAHE